MAVSTTDFEEPAFQRSARLRDFFAYVASQSLEGHAGEVNEHQIGCSVFEQPVNYSPADDNIVRVHARQLRTRLEEYFLIDGRDEPRVLEIPKGSYVPVFHERIVIPALQPAAPALPESRAGVLARVSANLALGVGVALTVATIVLAVRNWKLRQALVEPASDSQPWMLGAVLDPKYASRSARNSVACSSRTSRI